MPSTKKPAHQTPADTTAAVDAFMTQLEHPFKAEVEQLRRLVLSVDPGIAEGIKWNVPSFRTGEYFATTHLRAKAGIGLILHLGAKVRELPAGGVAIDDPAGLLKWLGKDRAQIEFRNAAEIERHRAALVALLAQWIRHV